jgi:hypothetical protein
MFAAQLAARHDTVVHGIVDFISFQRQSDIANNSFAVPDGIHGIFLPVFSAWWLEANLIWAAAKSDQGFTETDQDKKKKIRSTKQPTISRSIIICE